MGASPKGYDRPHWPQGFDPSERSRAAHPSWLSPGKATEGTVSAASWEPAQLRDLRAELQANPALAAQVVAESGTAQRSLRAVKAGEFLCMDIKRREMLL